MRRCKCGSVLPSNPYKIHNAPACEACYARWLRDGTEVSDEVDRIERDRSRELARGNKVRCKGCGGLFRLDATEDGYCGMCCEPEADE